MQNITKNVLYMSFIILSVLANFGAIVFGVIEFVYSEENIKLGVSYYLQVRTEKKEAWQ